MYLLCEHTHLSAPLSLSTEMTFLKLKTILCPGAAGAGSEKGVSDSLAGRPGKSKAANSFRRPFPPPPSPAKRLKRLQRNITILSYRKNR